VLNIRHIAKPRTVSGYCKTTARIQKPNATDDMNIAILIANILTLLAFVIHTFVGDKELKVNEPTNETNDNFQKIEKWTMARCGWHWVSFDLLFATIGLRHL
jgi:hypothetical protein